MFCTSYGIYWKLYLFLKDTIFFKSNVLLLLVKKDFIAFQNDLLYRFCFYFSKIRFLTIFGYVVALVSVFFCVFFFSIFIGQEVFQADQLKFSDLDLFIIYLFSSLVK